MRVDGVRLTGPQGSNGAVVPRPDNTYKHVIQLWDEVGLPREFAFADPTGTGHSLRFARDHYDPMFWDEESVSLGVMTVLRSPPTESM